MCDPVSIGMAVSTVATMYTQKKAGDAADDTAAYNARVSDNAAEKRREIGVQEENKERQATAQLLSQQRAQLGASGVELGSGSALQLQRDTQTIGETDALRIRDNYASSAAGMNTQADLTRIEGANAKANSRNQMVGTALAGTTSVAGRWYAKPSLGPAPQRTAVAI